MYASEFHSRRGGYHTGFMGGVSDRLFKQQVVKTVLFFYGKTYIKRRGGFFTGSKSGYNAVQPIGVQIEFKLQVAGQGIPRKASDPFII